MVLAESLIGRLEKPLNQPICYRVTKRDQEATKNFKLKRTLKFIIKEEWTAIQVADGSVLILQYTALDRSSCSRAVGAVVSILRCPI